MHITFYPKITEAYMNVFQKKCFIFALLLVTMTTFGSAAEAGVISTFDSNLEGWTASGATLSWDSSGNPGGSLKSVDADSAWAQIIAPTKFHGPWDSTGSVSADIKMSQSSGDFKPAFAISDGNTAYEYVFSTSANQTWQTFAVSLSDSGWNKLTGNSNWYDWNPPIGNHSLAQVLQNVQAFRIRTDLINGTGSQDTTYIDNVRAPLVPLPSALLLFGAALARLARRR